MKFTRSLLVLILFSHLVACSTAPAPSQTMTAPEGEALPVAQVVRDDRDMGEWQEQHRKNYFDWPVDDARLTRGYLPNRKRPHLGLDLAAPKGTNILAAQDGTVIYTGRDFRGFGRLIMIEGVNGWASFYAHLSSINVKEGQKVQQGQLIGKMGRTGRATGVHLHFEIRRTQGPVDPLLYLPGGSRLAKQ